MDLYEPLYAIGGVGGDEEGPGAARRRRARAVGMGGRWRWGGTRRGVRGVSTSRELACRMITGHRAGGHTDVGHRDGRRRREKAVTPCKRNAATLNQGNERGGVGKKQARGGGARGCTEKRGGSAPRGCGASAPPGPRGIPEGGGGPLRWVFGRNGSSEDPGGREGGNRPSPSRARGRSTESALPATGRSRGKEGIGAWLQSVSQSHARGENI